MLTTSTGAKKINYKKKRCSSATTHYYLTKKILRGQLGTKTTALPIERSYNLMQIQLISERFLYLTMESKIRMLDLKEHEDLKHCSETLLKNHINHKWDHGKIMNLMRTAVNNSDWEWLDNLGKELEQLREASFNDL